MLSFFPSLSSFDSVLYVCITTIVLLFFRLSFPKCISIWCGLFCLWRLNRIGRMTERIFQQQKRQRNRRRDLEEAGKNIELENTRSNCNDTHRNCFHWILSFIFAQFFVVFRIHWHMTQQPKWILFFCVFYVVKWTFSFALSLYLSTFPLLCSW